MNEMKQHEMPQAVPDERLDEVAGGGSGDFFAGSDGKFYAARNATDRAACQVFRCKFCGCVDCYNHASHCRAREAIRTQCQCCSNFESGVLRYNTSHPCNSICRASPSIDGNK